MAALTLERYFCLRENKMIENDKSKCGIVCIYIIFLWAFSIGFSMPKTLSIIEVFNNDTQTHVCASLFDQAHEEIYTIAKWIIAFALPYTIIIVFSGLLLKFLKEWSARAKLLHSNAKKPKNFIPYSVPSKSGDDLDEKKSLKNNTNQNDLSKNFLSSLVKWKRTKKSKSHQTVVVKNHVRESRTTKIKRRTTRFVLAVVISFLCAWSPLWMFQIAVTFSESQNFFLKLMSNLTLIIVYLGGVINPLLYMILTNNFREFFSSLLKKFFKT